LSGADLILFKRTQAHKSAQGERTKGVKLRPGAFNDCEFAHANCHTRPVVFYSWNFYYSGGTT